LPDFCLGLCVAASDFFGAIIFLPPAIAAYCL